MSDATYILNGSFKPTMKRFTDAFYRSRRPRLLPDAAVGNLRPH
jgi:hypothetical protein